MCVINPNKTVKALLDACPEFKEIMIALGFDQLTKPGMISSMGRFVTLAQGAKMKKIPLTRIKQTCEYAGYQWEDNNE